MFSLSRVRPEAEESRLPGSARSFGALIIDEQALDRVLGRNIAAEADAEPRPDTFDIALSPSGQLAAKQFFSAAAAQPCPSPRRPHGAVIGPPVCVSGGVDAAGFASLLAPLLPALAPWELWDQLAPLERSDNGCVLLDRFLLVVALLAATVSGKQQRAVYTLQGQIHTAFAIGGPAPQRGLRAAARLLGVAPARLLTAAEELGVGGGSETVSAEEAALVLYAALGGSSGHRPTLAAAEEPAAPSQPEEQAPSCCACCRCWPW